MKTIREVCKCIGENVRDYPICVETGCTYTMPSGNEIHTTTNNIVDYICVPNNGKLWSFDIDSEHIEYAKGVVSSAHCVEFFLGDSVCNLKGMVKNLKNKFIDVLFLDSKEFDEDHMVNEYKAVEKFLCDNHYVCVDDIHNENSVKYKKMVPILKEMGYNYKEIFTPTGLFFASKGYLLG